MGGFGGGYRPIATMEKYDPLVQEWREVGAVLGELIRPAVMRRGRAESPAGQVRAMTSIEDMPPLAVAYRCSLV